MDSGALLSAAKYLAPIVALLSALWSMTRKVTEEGADGRKRLTFAGRILVGLTAISTAISLFSIALESIVKGNEQRVAAIKSKNAAERERLKELRAQNDKLDRLKNDALVQRRFLENNLLILGKASEQQHRDALLSLQLARESNLRSADAQNSFKEFEKLNNPLRSISIDAFLVPNLSGIDLSGFWSEVRKLDNIKCEEDEATSKNSGRQEIEIGQFLGRESGSHLREFFQNVRFVVSVRKDRDFGPIRKIYFEPREVLVECERRSLSFFYGGNYILQPEGVLEGGIKVSASDAAKWVADFSVETTDPAFSERKIGLLGRLFVDLNGVAAWVNESQSTVDMKTRIYLLNLNRPQGLQ